LVLIEHESGGDAGVDALQGVGLAFHCEEHVAGGKRSRFGFGGEQCDADEAECERLACGHKSSDATELNIIPIMGRGGGTAPDRAGHLSMYFRQEAVPPQLVGAALPSI